MAKRTKKSGRKRLRAYDRWLTKYRARRPVLAALTMERHLQDQHDRYLTQLKRELGL